VPDTYPLSLNALCAGCNQKTARLPVIEASDAEVLTAIDGLKALNLVFEVSGSRVLRYEHNMPRVLGLPGAAVALLTTLMLRGPQTAAELRANCERLHRFADVSSVEGFLDEMASKAPPRVVLLARAPGAREPRWAQLLCGDVADAMPAASAAAAAVGAPGAGNGRVEVSAGELAALKAEQVRMAVELAELRGQVDRLARELGLQS
jgi:uncharacterized protein